MFYDPGFKKKSQDRALDGILLSKQRDSTKDEYTIPNLRTGKKS
jgi:hypothetical protein